jgi:hypothetical protein
MNVDPAAIFSVPNACFFMLDCFCGGIPFIQDKMQIFNSIETNYSSFFKKGIFLKELKRFDCSIKETAF